MVLGCLVAFCALPMSAQENPDNISEVITVRNEADFERAIALCKSELDTSNLNNPSHTKAYVANALNAEKWAMEKGNQEQVFLAKHTVLVYYVHGQQDVEVISRSKELLDNQEFREDSFSVGVAAALLYAYSRTGQHGEKLELLPEFYRLNFKHGTPYKRSSYHVYGDLAQVYYDLGNYNEAVSEYKQFAKGAENDVDYVTASSAFNNLGLCYKKLQIYDSAIHSYNNALRALEVVKNGVGVWSKEYLEHFANVIRGNIASIYIMDGNYERAIPLIKAEIRSGIQQREFHIVLGGYYALAEVFYEMDQPVKALIYLDSTFRTLLLHSRPKTQEKALLLESRCFASLGLKQQSDSVFKLYREFSDSMIAAKAEQFHANAAVKYDVKNKEIELTRVKEKVLQHENIIRNQTVVLIVIVAFLLFVSIFYWRSLKAKEIIRQQKSEVVKALHEKEILLKEIHHRVKNNLQVVSGLLDIQAFKFNNSDFDKAVKESKGQLETMALVHQMLYQYEDNTAIVVQEYLNKLCDYLINDETQFEKVDLLIVAKDVRLSLQKAIPLGLIVNELLTNAIKHAFDGHRGEIKLSVKKSGHENNEYVFTYQDNGQGLPKEVNLNTIQTQGLKLINMLSEEMDSKMEYFNDNGFNVRIAFKD